MLTIPLSDPKAVPRGLRFSLDGRLLAAWDRGRAHVIDTVAGVERATFGTVITGAQPIPSIGFTSAGHLVVTYHGLNLASKAQQSLSAYDVDSGERLLEGREQPPDAKSEKKVNAVRRITLGDVRAAEVSPDGRFVYVAQYGKGFVRLDPMTGECSNLFARHTTWTTQLSVSADGKWMAGITEKYVRLWHLGGKTLPARPTKSFVRKPWAYEDVVELSSDGVFLAYTSAPYKRTSAKEGQINVADWGIGEHWTVAAPAPDRCRELAFHPSRPVLAYSAVSAEVTFYDVVARAELKRYAWNVGTVTATAFSPDGLRCAAAAAGKVVIWDVDV